MELVDVLAERLLGLGHDDGFPAPAGLQRLAVNVRTHPGGVFWLDNKRAE